VPAGQPASPWVSEQLSHAAIAAQAWRYDRNRRGNESMLKKPARARMEKLLARYRVTNGKGFRLNDHDPDDTAGLDMEKDEARELLARGVAFMAEYQDMLYAQDRYSLLAIFQAMDAAGKDGTIKHVFSGINPQGCDVHSFKAPSDEEMSHDWLWRHWKALPERGRIGLHNRSHYEEVLVARVHPEILARQHLPPGLVGKHVYDERLADIRNFEEYLGRNGTVVRKFFLNIGRAEQKKRFMERLDDPAKNWKFNAGDVAERGHWKAYMHAYEEAIRATATPDAPWYVVPADNKWFTRLVVVSALVLTLDDMKLAYPKVDTAQRAALAKARAALLAED
jgi:PPK2 family polyphosphate:nucleotide phosphotransferase